MAEYVQVLKKDPVLFEVLQGQVFAIRKKRNIGLQLMLSIMSQQLSTKVAAVFQQRFLALFTEEKTPGLTDVLAISYEQLRSIGLSHAKATYVHAVAIFFVEKQLTDQHIQALPNDEVIALLTQIKGVGQWTVEMLLMFSMARTDVFPVDDLGIRQAMLLLYGIRSKDLRRQKARMQAIAAKWHPYQTYACLHLWHWKDNAPKL